MIIKYTRKELAEGNLKKKKASGKSSANTESLAKILKKVSKEN